MVAAAEIDRIVLVAGGGRYPELLIDALRHQDIEINILSLPGFDRQKRFLHLVSAHLTLENFCPSLQECFAKGYRHLAFAGSVQRPKFEYGQTQHVIDIQGGDDSVLREAVAMAEGVGFEVIGGHQLAPNLFLAPDSYIPTIRQPSEANRRDVRRAAHIVKTLGPADVGQAAVVVARLCVAIETVSGTNAMLNFAAQTIGQMNPLPNQIRGILYKGAKPEQELRLDMPAIGPDTVEFAARAGLAGIAIEANKVLLLDRQEIIAKANRKNMFIWSLDITEI